MMWWIGEKGDLFSNFIIDNLVFNPKFPHPACPDTSDRSDYVISGTGRSASRLLFGETRLSTAGSTAVPPGSSQIQPGRTETSGGFFPFLFICFQKST